MRNTRSGVGSPTCRSLVSCTISTIGVVLVAFCAAPLSVAQMRVKPAAETAMADEPTADAPTPVDLLRLARPLVRNAKVSRLTVSPGSGSVTSAGEPGQLVYSNTRGSFVFGLSDIAGVRIADDIATTAEADCSLDRYVVRVTGDKDGTGDTRPLTVTVALYDSCPGGVSLPLLPTPIANTECVATFVPAHAGELYDVECVIPPDLDILLPSTLYVAVTFDRVNAGWVVGAPAELGFSADQFDFPGFACAASLGGFPQFPHASFFTKIFVRDCAREFPAYRNTKQSGSAFTPGRLIRFGDDITLSVSDCNMVAYEVSVKGSCSICSGALLVDLKTTLSDSDPEAGNRIPGTSAMKFIFTNEIQVLHFDFDPPIPVPESFFITFLTGSDVVGPIVTGRQADIGETADTYAEYHGDAPHGEWVFQDFGDHIWSAFDVTVFCEGDPPAGACCDTIFTDEAGEAVCREMPEMNCPNNRWLEAEACEPDPFTPACGVGACCKPDDTCENLTLNECNAAEPVERIRLWRRLQFCETPELTCPFSACIQREGACGLARSSPGCRDPFCCTDVCEFDPFCCTVEWDRACLRSLDELCRFTFPLNDSCDGPTEDRGALAVQPNETVVISNHGARPGELEFFCDNETPRTPGLRTLWFKFEATETSTRISTCGSEAPVQDTLIQVFRAIDGSSREAACNSLEVIACNDDTDVCSTGTLSSVCATGLSVGETYFVKVGSKNHEDEGVLQVDFRSPCSLEQPVANDDCRLAESIVTGTTPFDLAGATFDFPGPACIDTMVNDLWYEWTAPVSGLATISSCGAEGDSTPQFALAVYERCGCPVDEAAVLCGESTPGSCPEGSEVQFKASEGVCYKIRVIGESGGAPAGDLSVKLSMCPVNSAQCLEQQKLSASDADTRDGFGTVSVSGDTALVGATGDDCAAGEHCGAAYVFRFNGTSWVEEQKLTASDAEAGDGFGFPVSVSGETALIGAHLDDCAAGERCGSAYVFRFDGTSWVEEQKLTASDAVAHGLFGRSLSLSGNTAVVSTYVFRFNGTSWVEEQKLTASDAAPGDGFGVSVSVSGDMAVVGAPFDDCGTSNDACGSAYVFRFDGSSWVEEQRLTASNAPLGRSFGRSVSVSGGTVVMGAKDLCTAGDFCGRAYVFRFDGTTWVEEQKLAGSDPTANDFFGTSVSLSGDTVVVGANATFCAAGHDCGSAYVFHYNGTSWIAEQRLTASDEANVDEFGGSVAVSGETIVVGAHGKDCAAGSNCGAAYAFSCVFVPTVGSLDIKPGSCPNPVNPNSQGVVPVAILGCPDFDVTMIDPDSLTLARADGVGEAVSPLSNRRGLKISVGDVATPFEGELCACHDFGGDGLDDLTLKFSTAEMSRALKLNELPKGETIELVLRGTLQDGTNFEARDCIVIPGSRRTSSGLGRTRRSK